MNTEIINLTQFFGQKNQIDFPQKLINYGDYVSVFGRSGSGKTTLLNSINEILKSKGFKTGYLLQNIDAQIVTDKVWHELAFGLENLGTKTDVMKLRVAEMTNYFGLQDLFDKNISELSGGQKQLLNLASIMADGPDVLLLDEPTSQLDPISALNFLNTIKKINLELGTTVILVEQRLEDVFSFSEKCIFMDKGFIKAFDSPRNIGKKLFEEKSDMVLSLPSPMRIFYGAAEDSSDSAKCPLSVRDGRKWLETMNIPSQNSQNEEVAESSKKSGNAKSNAKSAVNLKNVFFRYEKKGKDILRDVNVSIPEKSVFAVVGGNGSGKSTLLKIICGIKKPYSGKVKILDESNFENVVMLSQEVKNLFTKRTVSEELKEIPCTKEKLDDVISICELSEIQNYHPFDISGGESQKLAIAKLLLKNPRVMLLDEPTKGMDNAYKAKFASFLKKIASSGITVVIVSHDLEFCAICADLVGMFFNGQFASVLPPKQFFARNSFYTTSVNRMCRKFFSDEITAEGAVTRIKSLKNSKNGGQEK